jgi:hypothetical protein
MKKTYEERLRIPLDRNAMGLYTKSGMLVAVGYERIVIGKRGPYIEITDFELMKENFFIPADQKWRLDSNICYYEEYRTKKDNVKVYHQKKTVDYADYKIGMWYISPFDLKTANVDVLVEPLNRKTVDINTK